MKTKYEKYLVDSVRRIIVTRVRVVEKGNFFFFSFGKVIAIIAIGKRNKLFNK